MGTFDCGVSPGVICMDVRNASDISSIAGDLQSAVQGDFDLLGRGIPNFHGRNGWFIDASGNKRVQLGW